MRMTKMALASGWNAVWPIKQAKTMHSTGKHIDTLNSSHAGVWFYTHFPKKDHYYWHYLAMQIRNNYYEIAGNLLEHAASLITLESIIKSSPTPEKVSLCFILSLLTLAC